MHPHYLQGVLSFYFAKVIKIIKILSIRFYNSCRRLPETKCHLSLFLHWSGSKFLVIIVACTPIHVFLGHPLFLLSSGIHSIINFGILSSGILLTWPYHCSLFFSMMSGFPFNPMISFICGHLMRLNSPSEVFEFMEREVSLTAYVLTSCCGLDCRNFWISEWTFSWIERGVK